MSFMTVRSARVGLCLIGIGGALACGDKPAQKPADAIEAPARPDGLQPGETIAEAPIAFGMPLPAGMRVTRHFLDSAYFSGRVPFEQALEHVRQHVLARDVELRSLGAVIPQAYIQGDEQRRLFRIEVSRTAQGSQVYLQDITPPAVTQGLTEAERWQRAGRNPDGSLINPLQVQ
jgi:hypothetical protein